MLTYRKAKEVEALQRVILTKILKMPEALISMIKLPDPMRIINSSVKVETTLSMVEKVMIP